MENNKPTADSNAVLREEFDDCALLFNPDKPDDIIALNPVSAAIWKHLDGKHSIEDIMDELSKEFEDMPKDARKKTEDFIQSLIKKGFVK
jgi:SynChlorMet cassette protein ScmD